MLPRAGRAAQSGGMPLTSLSWPHALLAIAITAVWGTNFVVIRLGLDDLPPLLFATLRFSLAFLPAALFIRRPDVPWRRLAAYGILIGAGQFGLLFIAMKGDISPGLASLVVQSQVFFTIALSMRATGEKVQPVQWFAVALAASGVADEAGGRGRNVTDAGPALRFQFAGVEGGERHGAAPAVCSGSCPGDLPADGQASAGDRAMPMKSGSASIRASQARSWG